MRPFPSFSAIVEWENARLSGSSRATEMLRQLVTQSIELAPDLEGRPELIIFHESAAVPRAIVEAAVTAACPPAAPIDVRIETVTGSSYYQQKNVGAGLAARNYVLFVDSDVVPEPGWLRALLGSVGPGVEIVGGRTYVDPATSWGRAFGLFWFFPPRSAASGLRESRDFFANNILFRRDLFLRFQFPDLPLYRGQCRALSQMLRRDGVAIFIKDGARVSHAPPEPGQFVHRALCEGYDKAVATRLMGGARNYGLADLRRQLRDMQQRIERRSGQIVLPPDEHAAAVKLATSYVRVRFAGQRWAARSPERAGRLLGITSGQEPAPLQEIVASAFPASRALVHKSSLRSPALA